jgi:hypothetical protein
MHYSVLTYEVDRDLSSEERKVHMAHGQQLGSWSVVLVQKQPQPATIEMPNQSVSNVLSDLCPKKFVC